MRCSSICAVWAKVFCALACLVLFERVRSLGRLLIGRRLRLRKLMLHAEFLHRNLMLGLELVGVHLSLKLHLLQPHAVLFDGRLILHLDCGDIGLGFCRKGLSIDLRALDLGFDPRHIANDGRRCSMSPAGGCPRQRQPQRRHKGAMPGQPAALIQCRAPPQGALSGEDPINPDLERERGWRCCNGSDVARKPAGRHKSTPRPWPRPWRRGLWGSSPARA